MSLSRLLAVTALALGSPLAAPGAVAQSAPPPSPAADTVPLPEHPRPDFMRAEWRNLNGRWRFRTDAADAGRRAEWFRAPLATERRILVPFPWGSPLSGVSDTAEIAWYERTLQVPEAWRGRRVFLVVGASDWRTEAWLDGRALGEHEGGYTPFSLELTPHVRWGSEQRVTLRVDDRARPSKLEGKQGYGNARGVWQTVYLEARGTAPLETVHFTPRLARGAVTVDARLREPAPRDLTVGLRLTNREGAPVVTRRIARGSTGARFDVPLPNARRWSLEDPFLHEAVVTVSAPGAPGAADDQVETYFGMREFSVVNLPGTSIPYVALNGKPVYMQLALDQAYHPEGFYTFPSDAFMRDEILRSRQIGLTGQRVHIKVEVPRKLYWADRLGVLIMADVPNWWGPPDSAAFRDHEHAMRGMIARDYNHPSIFSWVLFNETWGLHTKGADGRERYLPETQRRVAQVYRLAKALDSTRLVEDNSVCCGRGHTETDLNTWHDYLAGWQWEERVRRIADSTFPGSGWNFEDPWTQGRQPNLNSEFGNVWGYEGSTGDVDWSWDYHMAVDAFRRHPKLAGWLYTEHHDVINEWNGYWRYDRSEKVTGLDELSYGMTLRDFHSPFYVAMGPELGRRVGARDSVRVPLFASFLADDRSQGDSLTLRVIVHGWTRFGDPQRWSAETRRVPNRAWMTGPLEPVVLRMPDEPATVVVAVRLEGAGGAVLHRNFTTFAVEAPSRDTARVGGRLARIASVPAGAYSDARWSHKAWKVLDGLKVNGTGAGFFEYRIPFPRDLALRDVESAVFLVEASSRPVLGKDRDSTARGDGDYMRGGGFHDPSRNPNAYPMTDLARNPSAVTVRVNGELAGRVELADDPADHRGILSWIAQPRDRRLREAGTYGERVSVSIPRAALERGAATGLLVVRLEVDEGLPGGLAIYGARFGKYPLDPTVAFIVRESRR